MTESVPCWVKEYQISEMIEFNYLTTEIEDIRHEVSNPHGGFAALFGAEPDGDGLEKDKKDLLLKRVRKLIQRTHPDKANGRIQQFKILKDCLQTLKNLFKIY